jgi:hypothetical protein
MVLGVDDFTQEFAYHNGRDQWLARDLLGYGTVSGLQVTVVSDKGQPKVEVASGVAVSPLGQLICVCPAQCAFLNDWLTLHKTELAPFVSSPPGSPPGTGVKLYVVLCYCECPTDAVPIPGEPCRSEDDAMAPSRLRDDFCLDLRLKPPDQSEEDALRDFVKWLGEVDISDSPPISTPLDEFLADVRRAAHSIGSPPGSPPEFMFGSPPSSLHIATGDACHYLRAAFRVWVTEVRQLWRPSGLGKPSGCADQGAGDEPLDEECLLLAELDVTLDPNFQVTDPSLVIVNEKRRPFLLHLRMLQEWLLCSKQAGTGTPPSISLGGDVTGLPGANVLQAIQTVPVVTQPLTLQEGEVLTFKNKAWRAALIPPPAPPSIPDLAGDVTGPLTANVIQKLQSVPLLQPSQSLTNGQVLTFRNNGWHAEALPPLAGDVTGNPNANTVERIRNVVVDMQGASAGEVLTFQGASWRVQPVAGNFVEHPAGVPRYFIVAAGIARLDGTDVAPPYNGLRVQVVNNDVQVTFLKYQPQLGEPKFQYIVKALPLVQGEGSLVLVNFLRFDNDFFLLRVRGAGGAVLDGPALTRVVLMIEVSKYYLA